MSSEARSWFIENSTGFSGQLVMNESLSRHTYYRIGGPAEVLAVPKTLADLQWLSEGIEKTGIRLFLMGQGSNVLVADSGFQGLIVKLNRLNLEIAPISSVPETSPFRLRTGGSVAISSLLRRASHEGWGGLEFLTGIPGSVGGAVVMNAGTHLGETREKLRKVEIYSLLQFKNNSTFYEGENLKFKYRKNLFLPPASVIWSAEWDVTFDAPLNVKKRIDETLSRRKATQPVNYPSCGSVFKNPNGTQLSAWQVIDQLGLRGHQIGNAQFSEKHPNFIINLGLARSSDVLALIRLAKSRAQKELGILLDEEVIYLG